MYITSHIGQRFMFYLRVMLIWLLRQVGEFASSKGNCYVETYEDIAALFYLCRINIILSIPFPETSQTNPPISISFTFLLNQLLVVDFAIGMLSSL